MIFPSLNATPGALIRRNLHVSAQIDLHKKSGRA